MVAERSRAQAARLLVSVSRRFGFPITTICVPCTTEVSTLVRKYRMSASFVLEYTGSSTFRIVAQLSNWLEPLTAGLRRLQFFAFRFIVTSTNKIKSR